MNPKPVEPMADVLIVDDDSDQIRALARCLSRVAGVRFASSGAGALAMVRQAPPDLILLDAEMPGMSGFEVCRALKADEALADVPVVFVTSHGEEDFEVAGFEAGAADFIVKPINPALVLARVGAQLRAKQAADELRQVSATDALTGVHNRRRFDQALSREWQRTLRGGDSLALLMVDVDHFKAFNDRLGHPAGDACLRAVALAMADVIQRPADLVARYGGEEFAVLLPSTPRAGALHVAALLLRAVEALDIAHGASPTSRHVTVSIGVACYDHDSPAWVEPSSDSRFGANTQAQHRPAAEDLLRAADTALYAAKHAGRAQAWLVDVADALAQGGADEQALFRPMRAVQGVAA